MGIEKVFNVWSKLMLFHQAFGATARGQNEACDTGKSGKLGNVGSQFSEDSYVLKLYAVWFEFETQNLYQDF